MTIFRELTDDDTAISIAQTAEAFAMEAKDEIPRVDRTRYGLFDGEHLAAQAVALRWPMFVGGVSIPSAGIGNVTVAPEFRGGGTAQRLLSELLRREREGGAVLSALFGGAPALYRRLGYALVERSTQWRIPLQALAGSRPTTPIRLRPAGADGADALAAVYREVALAGTMASDRSAAQPWAPWTRATVALLDDTVVGYLAFRSERIDDKAVIRVDELVALTPDGYRALIGSLGTWASVADAVMLQAGEGHPALAMLRGNPRPVGISPFMLRIVDVEAAVRLRGWSRATGRAVVRIEDAVLPENDGVWLLTAENGRAELTRTTEEPEITITQEGLAFWYSGVARLRQLRVLGLADGDLDGDTAGFLDALALSTPLTVTEFF